MNWTEYWNNNDINNLPWEIHAPDKNLVEFYSTIDKKNIKTAIDIGCGLGTNSLWIASQNVKVTAIDISERAIYNAKKNLNDKNFQIDFSVMDFLNHNNLLNNYYDFIFDRGCIHGMNKIDVEKFANEVSRIISPDGVWLSIIGSYDGEEVYCGPPRRTCSEMITSIEPYMKIISLHSSTMQIYDDIWVDVWILISKKRHHVFK